MNGNCVFCRIIAKEIETDFIAESPTAVAFRDINPQAPVHILIVPKEHVPTVKELALNRCELLSDMFSLVNELTVSEGIAQTGYRVVVNAGEDGGQDVDHVHFHLLGGRFLGWPPG